MRFSAASHTPRTAGAKETKMVTPSDSPVMSKNAQNGGRPRAPKKNRRIFVARQPSTRTHSRERPRIWDTGPQASAPQVLPKQHPVIVQPLGIDWISFLQSIVIVIDTFRFVLLYRPCSVPGVGAEFRPHDWLPRSRDHWWLGFAFELFGFDIFKDLTCEFPVYTSFLLFIISCRSRSRIWRNVSFLPPDWLTMW